MRLQRTFSVDDLNELERKTGSWTVGAKGVKEFETVWEFCNVAFRDISESIGDVCVELAGSYCQK